MTLDQIVAYVTAKVGQFDSASLSFCASAVNRRYEMIYDAEDWLDSTRVRPAFTVANLATVPLPSELRRAITIKVDGGETIEPVTVPFMIETDPDAFTAIGKPKYYTEFRDDTGVSQIQLWPIPDAVYVLLVYGKRVFQPLTIGTAIPLIRNIDNPLIAFVQADMLQRQRQYAKAQSLVQEAGALLDQMRATEQQRANRPRMTANLTVGGDSLAEMSDAVSARVKDYSVEAKVLIKEFLRRNYLEVYDSQLWPEGNIIMEVDRDGTEVVLPEYVDRVREVRQDMGAPALTVADICYFYQTNPRIFEQTGTPVAFSVLTSCAVAVLPPVNESLAIVSDDNRDDSPIFIRGESIGTEPQETINLNGITEVLTGYPYDTPLTLSKGITRGTITVVGATTRVFLVQLGPEERERKHIRLWLNPAPIDSNGSKCLLLGKRRIKPLVQDEDTPILRGMGTVLINLATADMFDQMGNKDMSGPARAKASLSLSTLVDRELKQTAYQPRVVPEAEPVAFCNWNNW